MMETALAKIEADLVHLNLQVQASVHHRQEEDGQMRQLVQTLKAALEREKLKCTLSGNRWLWPKQKQSTTATLQGQHLGAEVKKEL